MKNGAAGKTENCVVSVHLAYAAPTFHTLLDGELFLPEHTWQTDRARCRAAGITDDVTYRSKCDIALSQYQRAVSNGVRFAWLTFDEGYGGKPPFLRALDGLNQNYVAEVPVNFHVWTRPPQVLHRRHARDECAGRPRRYPRLKTRSNPTAAVADIQRFSPIARREKWQKYHVKDASKGPMIFEAKRITIWLKNEDGLLTHPPPSQSDRRAIDVNPGAKPQSRSQPSQTNPATITRDWRDVEEHTKMSLVEEVAL